MIPAQAQSCCIVNYGNAATYIEPPTEAQVADGVVPLDSLPADWWNWMWNQTNGGILEARRTLNSIVCEINNVLAAAGCSPQEACLCQLYQSIDKIRQTIATASVPGAVKSSSDNGKISIDANGVMTANGLGNVSSLTTTAKTNVVVAINEVNESLGNVSTSLSSLKTALCDGTCAVKKATQLQSGTGPTVCSECNNELNIYYSGTSWINYRGNSSMVQIGNGAGNGTLGTLKAATFCGNLRGAALSAVTATNVCTNAASSSCPTYVLGGISGSTCGKPTPYATSCLCVKYANCSNRTSWIIDNKDNSSEIWLNTCVCCSCPPTLWGPPNASRISNLFCTACLCVKYANSANSAVSAVCASCAVFGIARCCSVTSCITSFNCSGGTDSGTNWVIRCAYANSITGRRSILIYNCTNFGCEKTKYFTVTVAKSELEKIINPTFLFECSTNAMAGFESSASVCSQGPLSSVICFGMYNRNISTKICCGLYRLDFDMVCCN